MKIAYSVLAVVSLVGSVLPVQAADRKIGNVIAVERTIEGVYESCLEQIESEKSAATIYACKFETKNTNADLSPGARRLLNFSKNQCYVEATLQNSVILIMFNSKKEKATFTMAKNCLRDALDASPDKDNFKYVVYTIE